MFSIGISRNSSLGSEKPGVKLERSNMKTIFGNLSLSGSTELEDKSVHIKM